jgi:hypothetical protein
MPDYKAMYYHLAGRMAGSIEALEAITTSLKLSMQTAEDIFLNCEDKDDDSENA